MEVIKSALGTLSYIGGLLFAVRVIYLTLKSLREGTPAKDKTDEDYYGGDSW